MHAPGASPPSVLDPSKRVGYPAGLPTTNSQSHPETLTHTASQHPGGAEEERDRSGARSRAPPTSKPKAELKLSRSLSKSDSDLLTCSPTEDTTMGSRSESLSNCSIGKKRLEKSPSFASEWDEVRLCDVTGDQAGHGPPQLPCGPTPRTGIALVPSHCDQSVSDSCEVASPSLPVQGILWPRWQTKGPFTVKLEGGGPRQSRSEGEAVPRNDLLFGNLWIPLATMEGAILTLKMLQKSSRTLCEPSGGRGRPRVSQEG